MPHGQITTNFEQRNIENQVRSIWPLDFEWNNLDCDIQNSDSLNIFKLTLLKFVRSLANTILDKNIPFELKLLAR